MQGMQCLWTNSAAFFTVNTLPEASLLLKPVQIIQPDTTNKAYTHNAETTGIFLQWCDTGEAISWSSILSSSMKFVPSYLEARFNFDNVTAKSIWKHHRNWKVQDEKTILKFLLGTSFNSENKRKDNCIRQYLVNQGFSRLHLKSKE